MSLMNPQPKYALVIAAKPDGMIGSNYPEDQYAAFLGKLPHSAWPILHKPTIHNNVWLIPLDTSLPSLAKLIEIGNNMQIPLKILFFDDEPDWIEHPPKPKPDVATKT